MRQPHLEIIGVTKEFKHDLLKKNKLVVDNLSMTFSKGECTGLLGHNGAGKTTTIKMILGVLTPDSGEIKLDGKPIDTKMRSRIGYMPEINKLPQNITAYEAVDFHLKIYSPKSTKSTKERKARVNELLDSVGLSQHKSKKIKEMSKGMARRVAWAQAISHEPEFLILDEPASGLDPLGRRKMLDWISDYKKKGASILLCTHEINQLHYLCDQFHLMKNGKLALTSVQEQHKENEIPISSITENWKQNYNIHVSGVTEDSLMEIGKTDGLLPWQNFQLEGYLGIISFAEYADASSWLASLTKRGIVIVRFGDHSFVGEEELLLYFEGGA